MRKLLCGLVCVLFMLGVGCKKEGVSLVNAALKDHPTDKKDAFKWVKGVNRGQTVKIIEEQKEGEWMKVQLADGVTEGWIQKQYIHKGKKKIIVFTKSGVLYDQPDIASKKTAGIIAGDKALILRVKDQWYQISLNSGQEGWVKSGSFKEGTDISSKFKHEVDISGIGKSFVEASSMLPAGGGYTYTVMNLFDKNPGTTWQVGNGGIGEWIEITFPHQISVKVSIINGFVKIDPNYARYGAKGDLYELNNRIKSLKVEYRDARGAQRKSSVNLDDKVRTYQNAGIYKNVSQIRFIIDGIYKGLKWNDAAMAELKIEKL